VGGAAAWYDPRVVSGPLVHALQADAVAARVLGALEGAGIAAILLKGSALADLYPDQPRTYVDADVYVEPAAAERATAVLAADGWSDIRAGALEIERAVHASTWAHPSLPSSVDLHHTLVGIGRSDGEAWAVLWAHTEPFTVAGQACRRLDPAGRALHLALHVSQSGAGYAKGLDDLRRGLDRFEEAVWRTAAALADQLDATIAFVTGLGMVPEGAAMADRLGLAAPTLTVAQRLTADTASSGAKSLAVLAGRPSPVARLRYAVRRVFPSRTLIRATEPIAARGGVWLVPGYVTRVVRVLWRSPRAVREYRAARRAG